MQRLKKEDTQCYRKEGNYEGKNRRQEFGRENQ